MGLGIDVVRLAAGLRHIGTTSSRLVTDDVLLFSNLAEARTGDATGVLDSASAKMSAASSMSSAEIDVLSACVLTDDSKG
jgi:hypothetical protein